MKTTTEELAAILLKGILQPYVGDWPQTKRIADQMAHALQEMHLLHEDKPPPTPTNPGDTDDHT